MVINHILAPVMKVSNGAKSLLRADFMRRQGPKIPVGNMLQKPSPILPSLPMPKTLPITGRTVSLLPLPVYLPGVLRKVDPPGTIDLCAMVVPDQALRIRGLRPQDGPTDGVSLPDGLPSHPDHPLGYSQPGPGCRPLVGRRDRTG